MSDGKGYDRRNFLRQSAVASAGFALAGCAGGMQRTSERSVNVVHPVSLPPLSPRRGDYVEVNGARIFYQVQGTGMPMLLIHGYPLSGALFSRNRDALANRFTVVTIDQRGYGESRTPDEPADIATLARDALDVMDELGIERAVIGGHSMGGPVSFEMYKRAPERFTGMMLIDTIAAAASTIEANLWRGFAEEVRQKGPGMTTIAFLMKNMLTGDTRANQPELANYLSAVMKQASREAWIGGALALATRPDYTDLLSEIDVPTLVYVGVEDTVYPIPVAKGMHQKIPNSTLVTIRDAAHAAVFEAPERTNAEIMDWARQISM